MKLKVIAANQTELHLNDGLIVFFSYSTPVAARTAGGGYVRTSTKWSTTTTRHINKWLDGITAYEVTQEWLELILSEVGRTPGERV